MLVTYVIYLLSLHLGSLHHCYRQHVLPCLSVCFIYFLSLVLWSLRHTSCTTMHVISFTLVDGYHIHTVKSLSFTLVDGYHIHTVKSLSPTLVDGYHIHTVKSLSFTLVDGFHIHTVNFEIHLHDIIPLLLHVA